MLRRVADQVFVAHDEVASAEPVRIRVCEVQRVADRTGVLGNIESDTRRRVELPERRESGARITNDVNESRVRERSEAGHVTFVSRRLLDPEQRSAMRDRRRPERGREREQRCEPRRYAWAQRRVPAEQGAGEVDRGTPVGGGPPEPKVRLEIRIDEACNPVRREPVHRLRRRRGSRNVAERSEVSALARQRQDLRMVVEQILQQRRAAALMTADEYRAQQPFEGCGVIGVARWQCAEPARFAGRCRGVVRETREQLCARRRARLQQSRDRRLRSHPVSTRRHDRESTAPFARREPWGE